MTWSYSAGILTSSGATSGSPDLLSAGVAIVQAADATRGYVNGFVAWLNNVEVRAGGSFISIDADLQLELRGSSFFFPSNGGIRHDYRSTLVINTSTARIDSACDFRTGSTFQCRRLNPNDPNPRIIYRNTARHDYPNVQSSSTPSSIAIDGLDVYGQTATSSFLKLYFGLASSASVSNIRFFNAGGGTTLQVFSTTYNDIYNESLRLDSESSGNTITINRPTYWLASPASFGGDLRGAQVEIYNPTFLNSSWNTASAFNFSTVFSNSRVSIFYGYRLIARFGLTALSGVQVRWTRAVEQSQNSPSWSAPANATISATTNISGTISAVNLLDTHREGTGGTAAQRFNWTMKARIYNYTSASETVFASRVFYQANTILSAGYVEEVQMLAVPNLAGVSAATAAAITNIALVASGATGGTATITATRTIQNLWNYYRSWIATLGNFDSEDTWNYEGQALNLGAWNLTIGTGGSLTTGQLTTTGTITLISSGIPSFTAIVPPGGTVIVVGSGATTDLSSWTFSTGTTINRSPSGSATVIVAASQTGNITAGTGVTVQAPPNTLTLTGFPAGSKIVISQSGLTIDVKNNQSSPYVYSVAPGGPAMFDVRIEATGYRTYTAQVNLSTSVSLPVAMILASSTDKVDANLMEFMQLMGADTAFRRTVTQAAAVTALRDEAALLKSWKWPAAEYKTAWNTALAHASVQDPTSGEITVWQGYLTQSGYTGISFDSVTGGVN